jgi:hypothetical protein
MGGIARLSIVLLAEKKCYNPINRISTFTILVT